MTKDEKYTIDKMMKRRYFKFIVIKHGTVTTFTGLIIHEGEGI